MACRAQLPTHARRHPIVAPCCQGMPSITSLACRRQLPTHARRHPGAAPCCQGMPGVAPSAIIFLVWYPDQDFMLLLAAPTVDEKSVQPLAPTSWQLGSSVAWPRCDILWRATTSQAIANAKTFDSQRQAPKWQRMPLLNILSGVVCAGILGPVS